MHSIQKTSRLFRYFFILLFYVFIALDITYWATSGQLFIFNNVKAFAELPGTIPPLTALPGLFRLFGFLADLIPLAFNLIIIYFLIRLFALYEQLKIFTMQNVRYYRMIGWTLLVKQMAYPFYQMLMTLILTFNNPPGERSIGFGVSETDLTAIVTGLLLILISWIMDEGRKLKEEQDKTI